MRQDNLTIVRHFIGDLKSSGHFFITDHTGLKDEDLKALRLKLDLQRAQCRVIKNTLFKRIAREAGIQGETALDPMLAGPSSFTLGGDDVTAVAKVIVDFAKANGKLGIKGGFIEGKILDKNGVEALAAVPSRPELLTRLVRVLNSPISGIVTVLSAGLRDLVNVLDAVKEKKTSENNA